MISCNNRSNGFLSQSIAIYCKDERGSATVMSAGIIVCILIILGIVAGVLNMKVDTLRLQSIANIVALSSANEAFFGVDGCKVAQSTAMLNDATITECNSEVIAPNTDSYYAESNDSDASLTELVPKVKLTVKLSSSNSPLISASATAKTTDLPCGVRGFLPTQE